MHDQPREGKELSPSAPPSGTTPEQSVFAGQPPRDVSTAFTTDVNRVTPAAPGEAKPFSRMILPAILLVAIIGGLAWVTQYMPAWRGAGQRATTTDVTVERPLHFAQNRPVWDKDDPEYILEWERGVRGHYDYVFTNKLDTPVELGLKYSGCDCSTVKVASITSTAEWEQYQREAADKPPDDDSAGKHLTWHELPVDRAEQKHVVIPAGAKGVVRLTWVSRKQTGEALTLRLELFMRPQGSSSRSAYEMLDTPVRTLPPIVYHQEQIDLGVIGGQEVNRADFVCWTSTRPTVDLEVANAPNDPCFVCAVTPLSDQEAGALEKKLREEEINTRVKKAFRVSVAVYEQRKGKLLDQGPFTRRVPLVADGEPLDPGGPLVVGQVRGEVRVGTGEEQGKLQLPSFRASDGTRAVILLRSPKDTSLRVESQQPPYLRGKLTRQGSDASGTRTNWRLEVVVPPDSPAGPLPEDAGIILRTEDKSRRAIRIPVVGNALQG